jgi:undecaprenyl phosphate-alpha-L-ara4N flippase subunit ArnE
MDPRTMIWISVILSALAQIFLKRGLSGVQNKAGPGLGLLTLALLIGRQGFIWGWAACFAAAMGLWLVGLKQLELSYAYPLVSVGYVLVTILSATFFHERVDSGRWLAVGIISLGVTLIAGS